MFISLSSIRMTVRVEPGSPMSQELGELVITTVRDYDLSDTPQLLLSVYISVAMMGVIHTYFQFTQ
ncbi:hypothetical protein BDZ97DRAFT_1832471 [Flammula alnicola]|nr:hypothetical protein BDZ97DRAFT_1832471 [Flammula alnicola]